MMLRLKQSFKIQAYHFVVGGLLMFAWGEAYGATVKSIEYKSTASGGEVIIRSDAKIEYESETNAQDRQVVINLKQAELSVEATKTIDTSAKEGPVVQVSAYKVEGAENQARVVVQLWENSTPQVTRSGNMIRIAIPKANGKVSPESQKAEADRPNEVGIENLENFMSNAKTKRFSGTPVTIQVRDAELSDVLRLIAEASGFNILVGDGVGGKITLSLVDVPWDQALDVILSSKRLGAERKNNILRIATLTNLATEKEEELRAKQASEKAAPRITRIFPISYATAPALQKLLDTFSNSLASGGAGPGGGAASIQVDDRTNSLIIQDTAVGIDRMAKLVRLLDVETPQVLIEAKIIEASEQFSKDLKGSLGVSRINAENRGISGSFNGGALTTGLPGSPSVSPSSQLGYSPSIAFLPNLNRLNALLSISEASSDTRVVASPKTVVMNKKQAKITQETPVANFTTTTGAGGVTTQEPKVTQAKLTLSVTPVVTNTGSVLLNLDIQRDTIENTSAGLQVAPRNLTTEVLVDSGSTLVIGGIYTMNKTKTDSGFPFLKDIPFLGWLFGEKTALEKKNELLIFVTPRIINEKRSSIAGGASGGNEEPAAPPAG